MSRLDADEPGADVVATGPAPTSAVLAVVIGGLLMTVLYVPFTLTHGPTSDNESRTLLGADMHVWGLVLGVLPNVAVGVGFWRLKDRLAEGRLLASLATTTMAVALFASAALDLAFRALGPPLALLVLAPAVVTAAVTTRRGVRGRGVVALLGLVLVAALVLAVIPAVITDPVGGYRVFGVLAYGVAGLLWAALGLRLRGSGVPVPEEPATRAARPGRPG